MSDQFYSYIGENILSFMDTTNIRIGDRFSVQFEKKEEVNDLYEALRIVREGSKEFVHQNEDDCYTTFCYEINGLNLVVAATVNGIKEDYLTYLRNINGKEETVFADTAMLFIHDSSLDSILGGSKQLQMEGMPLHSESISRKIINEINTSTMSDIDKEILLIYLKNKHRDTENTEVRKLGYWTNGIRLIINRMPLVLMSFTLREIILLPERYFLDIPHIYLLC